VPNAPVDVANGAPNLESYVDNGDGTVLDLVTGLVWEQSVPDIFNEMYTQADAVTACANLLTGGYPDWRLPTVIELLSITDWGRSNPSQNQTYFPLSGTVYWSSTPAAGMPGNGWVVSSYYGGADIGLSSTPQFVRCVR